MAERKAVRIESIGCNYSCDSGVVLLGNVERQLDERPIKPPPDCRRTRPSTLRLQQSYLEPPPLDLAFLQPLQRGIRQLPTHCYQCLKITDADLADGVARQAGIASECAKQIAGAYLVLASTGYRQGTHRRQQRLVETLGQLIQLTPGQGLTELLLDTARSSLFRWRDQAQGQAGLAGTAAAANAMSMHGRVGRQLGIDHRGNPFHV